MYREQLILIDYTDFKTKIGYYIPVIVAYIVFLFFFKIRYMEELLSVKKSQIK